MAPVTRRRRNTNVQTVRRNIPPRVLIKLNSDQHKKCMLCGRTESSELLYGQLYQFGDVIIHHYCILLSTNSIQKGSDSEGILGFLVPDIKSELRRGSKIKCHYCNKLGATVLCYNDKCQKVFHLPCGMENGSLHQYFGVFKSFCKQHRMFQKTDPKKNKNAPTVVPCDICKEETVSTTNKFDSLWAPCCNQNAWFHRECVQNLALNSGFFFRCPLCNNTYDFQKCMRELGIYVPTRDAAWENDPLAFADLIERPKKCSAARCLCPNPRKRKYRKKRGPWKLIKCFCCGANCTHVLCSNVKKKKNWFCATCFKVTGPDSFSQFERSDATDHSCSDDSSDDRCDDNSTTSD